MPSYPRTTNKLLDFDVLKAPKLQLHSAAVTAEVAEFCKTCPCVLRDRNGPRRPCACSDRASRRSAGNLSCPNGPKFSPSPRSYGTSHLDDAVPPVLLLGAEIDSDKGNDDSEHDDEEKEGPQTQLPQPAARSRGGGKGPEEEEERRQAKQLLDEFRQRCEVSWKRKTLADAAPVSCEARPTVVQRDFPVCRRDAAGHPNAGGVACGTPATSVRDGAELRHKQRHPQPPLLICTSSNPRTCPIHRGMAVDHRPGSPRPARAPKSLLSQLLQRKSSSATGRPYPPTPFANRPQSTMGQTTL